MGHPACTPVGTRTPLETVPAYSKSEGLTESERYLKRLCESSFLSMWSYPNLYRTEGKELCDLLVVFEDTLIIFSDKSCLFPATGSLETDWKRWYRKSVQKSVEQAHGAERWLRRFPDRVFMDAACKVPFPIKLPASPRIHRVIVAVGATERCREFHGGSGSLIISGRPEFKDDQPFTVGWVDPELPYVHVLDEVTLPIVLRELDTTSDFIAYLRKKEALIEGGGLLMAAGEEQLLGRYIGRLNADGEHDFNVPTNTAVVFDETFWPSISSSPEYAAKKAADRISYAWDTLIEEFAKHMAAGTLAYGNAPLGDHEPALRAMASEPRLGRRVLSEALVDLMRRTPPEAGAVRVGISSRRSSLGYVFVLHSPQSHSSIEKFEQARRTKLHAYSLVMKHLNRGLETVVGIALTTPGNGGSSEDLIYYDVSKWSEEEAANARWLHEEVGLLSKTNKYGTSAKEYPVPPEHRKAKNRAKKQRQSARQKARRR